MLSLRLLLIQIDHICRLVDEHNQVEIDIAGQIAAVDAS